MYWYVLYVKTGQENNVEQLLKKRLDARIAEPFIPLQEIIFKSAKYVKKEVKCLFPGYVFVQSTKSALEFSEEVCPIVKSIKEAYFFLHYGEKHDISLKDDEKLTLSGLFCNNYCVDASVGFMKGDSIRIVSGALVGMESKIKKINRHKREAIIEVEMMGSVRNVAVALEVVEKL